MPLLDASQALNFVQRVQTTDGGLSIYDQLKLSLAQALSTKPSNLYDNFEAGYLAKQEPNHRDNAPLIASTSAPSAAATVGKATLFGNPDLGVDPETGEPIEPDAPNDYECEDVEADATLFDALGVGLGRPEMTAVALAVKRLGEDSARNVATVRFFGKFLGTGGDYYVYECTLKDYPEMPEAPEGTVPYEPYGEGLNAYVYFVSPSLGGPLSLLPYVTPDQVKASRAVHKFLTGKLDAQVSAYPPFPGKEAHYLRSLIARIAAATVACPAGFFLAEEDGTLSKNDEWKAFTGREMALPVNWSHRYAHVKAQGRTVVFKRELPEEFEEREAEFYTPEEREEGPAPLSPLEQDAALSGLGPAGSPAWSPLTSSATTATKHQVGGVRSNVWPGAVCACSGAHFSNVYVGWGLKGTPFKPSPPPPMAPEVNTPPAECNDLPPKPAPPEEEEDA